MVGDLGFTFDEKHLKRSGMDYLEHVTPEFFRDFPDVLEANPGWSFSMYSSKVPNIYTQAPFQRNHFLVFGSETHGLPEAALRKYPEFSFRIPMLAERRSLNLSTSVGIVLYEALRQLESWPCGPLDASIAVP